MNRDRVITLEALYELHKEWNDLMADREAIRARPYDDDAEQGLILRLQEHHAKLESIREALLRQCKAASDQHPLRRRTDLTGAHK